jgi:uncharacterized membrane protein (Fun14 family)
MRTAVQFGYKSVGRITFIRAGSCHDDMVSILAPDLSTTFLVAAILPLIIGFIVGVIIKSALKIGILLAVLVLVLIALGIITPEQVLSPVLSLVRSGSALASEARRVAGYLPYSSVTFIIGLAIGFLKG